MKGTPRDNTLERGRCGNQTKPMQECHPERSEGSVSDERFFASLRMTKRHGLVLKCIACKAFYKDLQPPLPLHVACRMLYAYALKGITSKVPRPWISV